MTEKYKIGAETIEKLRPELTELSKKIAANPELMWEEFKAHDWLTEFLKEQGFQVTPHFKGLPTAFEARFGSGAPVVTVCCEYDALPGIGHACGHNLIAITSVATGVALKASLQEKGENSGTVIVLGTPAEEGGGGKCKLLDAGAFEKTDFSVMMHPVRDDMIYCNSLAAASMSVVYKGQNAHASLAPWEGVNALDAAVMAYSNVSVMRQQIQPHERIHGIIKDGGEKPNIIPSRTQLDYIVRAKNKKDLDKLMKRCKDCFDGAATATGCSVEYKYDMAYLNILTNDCLATTFNKHYVDLTGRILPSKEEQMKMPTGSTDFGNVSYHVPGIHPCFGIATVEQNHTPGFTHAVTLDESHDISFKSADAMFRTCWDTMTDPALLDKAKSQHKEQLAVATD